MCILTSLIFKPPPPPPLYVSGKSQWSLDFCRVEHIQLKMLFIKKLLKVKKDGFITLIVMLAPQVYAYVQTHQNVYIKSVYSFHINYTSKEL